jgi:hypothetical protein
MDNRTQQADFITRAAEAFEARWTMLTLARVDRELYEALQAQCELYYQACLHGDVNDAKLQGEALVRGYAAAVRVMEGSGVPDNAYLVGRYKDLTLLISEQKAVQRVDPSAIMVSPDEVAALFYAAEGLKRVIEIKQIFPGAEVAAVRKPKQVEE